MWLNTKNLFQYGELFLECDQIQHNFQKYAKEYFVLNFFRCNFAWVYQKKGYWQYIVRKKNLKSKYEIKKKWSWRFSITKSEKNNHQIHICDFHWVAKYIRGWLKGFYFISGL
jgi:hypothetical protein